MPEQDDEEEHTVPRMSADSQAFIGLKLRELYNDVVAEPVPARILDLLGRLGDDDRDKKSKPE